MSMEGKHRHVPDPYVLAGIEAHHVESTETPGWCANAGCGQGWPCVPKKMADEVRRLTAEVEQLRPATLREQVADLLDRKTRVTHPDRVADDVLAVVADWLAAQLRGES